MKYLIVITKLKIWSIEDNVGAPSFYETIKSYLDNNWEVYLLTNEEKNNFVTNNNLHHIHVPERLPSFAKVPIVRFIFNKFNTWISTKQFIKAGRELIKKLNIKKDCVIYAYEVHGVSSAKRLSMEFDIPFVSRFQGTVLGRVNNNLLNNIKYYPHFKALKTKADAIIMTDDGTQGNLVLKRLKNKTESIYFWRNGVEIERDSIDRRNIIKNQYHIEENEVVFLTLSRLVRWKRVDRAIDLIKFLNDHYDIKSHLLVIGDGEEKESLHQYSKRIGINDSISFVGAVNHSSIHNYFSVSKCFLSFYDLSNVGNPLLEAMKSDMLVVTLNNGDTGKLIQHRNNGLIFNEFNVENISKEVFHVLKDSDLYHKIVVNAKKYADKNFISWNERMSNELNMISALIGQVKNVNA